MTLITMLLSRGTDGLPPVSPVDFSTLTLPPSPNTHLVAPPGLTTQPHEALPMLAVTPDEAWAALRTLGDGLPRVWKRAEWPDRRQVAWVARSRFANFPDLIDGQVVEMPGGAGVFLYSRSLIGWSDFGVNRRRLTAWRTALSARLR